MKQEEILICDFIHGFVDKNWNKINKARCNIEKTKIAFLDEVKTDMQTALWILDDVCSWGMDKKYLRELFVETIDDYNFRIIKIENKYIKIRSLGVDKDYAYVVCFTEPKPKEVIYFE